jgi:photosystem II stability/assembly factor-like uncharacterized protein
MTSQPGWLGGMQWRLLGPYRGGRATVVVGHPTDRNTFYFGASGGGLWKTDDGGHLWQPMADDYLKTAPVGAFAVAPSATHIMYAGMGENVVVQFHARGDGVYRTSDAGKTWQHMGLAETHTITKLRVHPSNPNLVYAAALGHRFGTNPERGIYRSKDGGKTWEHVLFRSEKAGAIDLTMDTQNPDILYAAFWEQLIQPWNYTSGGEDSAIYRSTDGGDTWEDISKRSGLPGGVMGKIALSASPAKSGRLWALIEADEGGIYRSDDYGERWTWLCDERNFLVRARFSFALLADPIDPNTVYVPSRKLWKSTDGGRTFGQLNVPYVDQHDLWVDPHDNQRMILGDDGGASVSYDGGRSWSTLVNQPTAEIYRVTTDNHFPYRVYGSQQDNSTLCLPHRSERGGISHFDWYDIGGGESGYIAVRPDDPNIVYSSDLPGLGVTRYDHRNFQLREIGPWGEAGAWDKDDLRYRFNWCVPVKLSPHDPNTLYVAAQVVFRSTNEGESWEIISPDLTRADPATMIPTGGPIQREDALAFEYPSISSVAESPYEQGVIWVGTDDGLIQVTRDNGASWTNVTPRDLPEWSTVRMEVSRFAAGKAYAVATNERMDDFRPHLFKTDDYGSTWTRIVSGIPEPEFARVIREDLERPGLLYAGTDRGVWYSLDDGVSWFALKLNLPAAEVYDLCVKEDDVIIATHGRSMWSLDNISALRTLTANTFQEGVHLFPVQPVTRITREVHRLDSLLALYTPYVAPNPPNGVIVDYYLRETPNADISIELIDGAGEVIQRYTSHTPPDAKPRPVGPLAYKHSGGARLQGRIQGEEELGLKWGALTLPDTSTAQVPKQPGINRFIVPIHAQPAQITSGLLGWVTPAALVPGMYTIRLTVGDQVYESPLRIDKDPRVNTTTDEYQAQYDLLIAIRNRVNDIHRLIGQLRRVRAQLEDRAGYFGDEQPDLRERCEGLVAALTEIENKLIQPGLNENSGELDGTHFPDRVDGKLQALSYQVARSDNAPTRQAVALWEVLEAQVREQEARFQSVIGDDLSAFNALCRQHDYPIVRG